MGLLASVSLPAPAWCAQPKHGVRCPRVLLLATGQLTVHGSSAVAGPASPAVDEAMDDGGDQEERIVSYEEALAKIKDTTGVSDIQEVVDRFLNQVGVAHTSQNIVCRSCDNWPHPLSLPG